MSSRLPRSGRGIWSSEAGWHPSIDAVAFFNLLDESNNASSFASVSSLSSKRAKCFRNDAERLDARVESMSQECFIPLSSVRLNELRGRTLRDVATQLNVSANTHVDKKDLVDALVTSAQSQTMLRDRLSARNIDASHLTGDALLARATEQIEQNGCPICTELFAALDTVLFLPCGHGYHKKCISTWLHTDLKERHKFPTCPTCRRSIDEPRLEPRGVTRTRD